MSLGLRLTKQTLAAVTARVFFIYFLAGHDVHQAAAEPTGLLVNHKCQKRIESSWLIDGKHAPQLGLYIYEAENGRSLCLKLSRVDRDRSTATGAEHWLMQFAVIGKNGMTRPFCLPDNKGETWALAYREENGKTRLTCSSGAYAKCLRLGYIPWLRYKETSLAPYHKACTTLIRADYLGDGSSHTVPGIAIDISDDLGILKPSSQVMFEGGWDQHGAVCIRKWRLPHSKDDQLISIASRLRGGYGEASCNLNSAKKRGAILFSGKYP
jgi:hypothetical protein